VDLNRARWFDRARLDSHRLREWRPSAERERAVGVDAPAPPSGDGDGARSALAAGGIMITAVEDTSHRTGTRRESTWLISRCSTQAQRRRMRRKCCCIFAPHDLMIDSVTTRVRIPVATSWRCADFGETGPTASVRQICAAPRTGHGWGQARERPPSPFPAGGLLAAPRRSNREPGCKQALLRWSAVVGRWALSPARRSNPDRHVSLGVQRRPHDLLQRTRVGIPSVSGTGPWARAGGSPSRR
jgi:hypothetical protein